MVLKGTCDQSAGAGCDSIAKENSFHCTCELLYIIYSIIVGMNKTQNSAGFLIILPSVCEMWRFGNMQHAVV